MDGRGIWGVRDPWDLVFCSRDPQEKKSSVGGLLD